MVETDAIRIRPATIDDVVACADLYLAARKAAVPAIPPPVHAENAVRDWLDHLIRQPTETWLAEDDGGEVVGLLVLRDDWVDQLYVGPDRTGRGLGTRLLDLAKQRRPDGLRLWTFQSNTGALRFYGRNGFVEAERTDGGDNEERAPDVRLVWNP